MENKDDILKGLYGIKEELSKEIFELENKLYLTRCSLDDINEESALDIIDSINIILKTSIPINLEIIANAAKTNNSVNRKIH